MSEYQDPLLTPGHIKKIVQNLPGKIKLSHKDYEYGDCDTLENETNDFFDFSEVVEELQEYRKAYEETYTHSLSWKSLNETKRRQRIHSLLEQLDSTDKLGALKNLLYIALGNFNFSLIQDLRINNIKRNNAMICHCNGFSVIYQKFQNTITQYKSLLGQIQNNLYFEINGYLTLLYFIVETQRRGSNKFTHELAVLDINIIEFLSSLFIQLNEKPDPLFPTKKLVLLFWKCLLAISGGHDAIKGLGEETRKLNGLDTNPDIVTKCKPDDILHFQSEMTDKYSGYITKELPLNAPISVSTLLTSTLEQPDANYHPSLPRSASFTGPPKRIKNELDYYDQDELILPVGRDQLPKSIREATDTYFQNMYISLGDFQMIQERLKGYTKEELPAPFSVIEVIFEKLVPELQTILIFLLKLLLHMVTETRQESVDVIRNREIYSKAISGIFMLILKWTKASHVLKFEYVSQLLMDSGCLLLMLKIMGMYDLTALAGKRTDIKQYCFLNHHTGEQQEDEDEDEEVYTNRRNMFWIINYLRILQMLTKNKSHRIMMLVHYKSSVILKHILKISHTEMEYYALKLLKSQVPYLGKKWKSVNMKVISAIYLRCYTSLKDDWISGPELNGDSEESKIQEMNIRILTRLYIGEHYLPDLLPTSDTEPSPVDELDPVFMENYEEWLDKEVFSHQQEEEEEEEEEEEILSDDSPMTPIPTQAFTFSHEKLMEQMNTLYLEELENELKTNQSSVYDLLFDVEEKTMEKWTNS
ncbi:hypothetical protein K501DRAFT_52946 [Backusella circina FSU 941]|nr:hypothetical protein K501DRAFT_52946 [Backusella circina FSU 941]